MSDKSAFTQYKLFDESFKWQELLAQSEDGANLPEEAKQWALEQSSIPDLTNTLLYYIAEAEGLEETLGKEIARLQERKNRFKRKADNMRSAIKNVFERFDIRKINAPFGDVYTQKSSKLCVLDEGALLMQHPELFKRQEPKLDKIALKKLLSDGEVVDGVELQDRTILTIRK